MTYSTESPLPPTWATAQIGEVAEINPGLKKSDIEDRLEVAFVPMPAVEAESGRMDVSAIRRFGEVKKGYTAFAEGDVLFAKITPCMENGKMAVVPALRNGLGLGSTEFHVLRPRAGISAQYLYYFVSAQPFRRNAEHNMTGAVGQRRVPMPYLAQHPIPVSPESEQRRIVAKIEELFSELDKGVDSLTTAREQLKVYREAILQRCFLSGAAREFPLSKTQLPRFWRWEKLSALTTLITKGASPKWQGINYVDDQSQTLFVTSENIRGNFMDLHKPKFVQNVFNEGQKRSILKVGDVLFNIVGASIGRAAIFDDERRANINQAVALIRIEKRPIAEYVAYFLNSALGQSAYMDKRVEVARANLSLKDVGDIEVPLPPPTKLQGVVDFIEASLSRIDALEKELNDEEYRAGTLRQAILKRAFSGQLVAQDPADEPATVLLERIRAEQGDGSARRRRTDKNGKNNKKEAA